MNKRGGLRAAPAAPLGLFDPLQARLGRWGLRPRDSWTEYREGCAQKRGEVENFWAQLQSASLRFQCHVCHVSPASRNLEIVTEIWRERAQLVERPHFELASPLACHAQLLPDLDERARRLSRETEPQFEQEAEAIV